MWPARIAMRGQDGQQLAARSRTVSTKGKAQQGGHLAGLLSRETIVEPTREYPYSSIGGFMTPHTICRTLHRLTTKLHKFEARVQFVVLAFKHDLVDEIISYELWDRGYEGLGERQFDTCFESGDSEDVIAALITTARTEGFIDRVRSWCGDESFARWCSYTDRQGALF